MGVAVDCASAVLAEVVSLTGAVVPSLVVSGGSVGCFVVIFPSPPSRVTRNS